MISCFTVYILEYIQCNTLEMAIFIIYIKYFIRRYELLHKDSTREGWEGGGEDAAEVQLFSVNIKFTHELSIHCDFYSSSF